MKLIYSEPKQKYYSSDYTRTGGVICDYISTNIIIGYSHDFCRTSTAHVSVLCPTIVCLF